MKSTNSPRMMEGSIEASIGEDSILYGTSEFYNTMFNTHAVSTKMRETTLNYKENNDEIKNIQDTLRAHQEQVENELGMSGLKSSTSDQRE